MASSAEGLYRGDCLDWLRSLPDGCVDAVFCDPPYPEIDRQYGRLTEAEWEGLMHSAVRECRRVLTSTGSAMFVLQPNSRKVGSMRGWLWEFMAWVCREWNMVQDLWWWNVAAPPTVHCQEVNGLSRPSLKALVWCGERDCYRDQDAILWNESAGNAAARATCRSNALTHKPSGHMFRERRILEAAVRRGGVTPFNVWPIPNSVDAAGSNGHGARTPLALTSKMVSYLTPPGGLVIDPFLGSGTTAVAAIRLGMRWGGAEMEPTYWPMIEKRVAEAEAEMSQRLPLEFGNEETP